jgi:hypothetical protein
MAQIFRPRTNSIARASLVAAVLMVCVSGWILHAVYWSPWTTLAMTPIEQPVPKDWLESWKAMPPDKPKGSFANLPLPVLFTVHPNEYAF